MSIYVQLPKMFQHICFEGICRLFILGVFKSCQIDLFNLWFQRTHFKGLDIHLVKNQFCI